MEIEGKDFNLGKLLDWGGCTVKYSLFNRPFLTTVILILTERCTSVILHVFSGHNLTVVWLLAVSIHSIVLLLTVFLRASSFLQLTLSCPLCVSLMLHKSRILVVTSIYIINIYIQTNICKKLVADIEKIHLDFCNML